MRKFRLAAVAFVVVGTLNLLAFIYVAGHGEYAPANYSRDYPSASNIPAQVPAWIGRMH
jgi:hypothetical protein